MNRKDKRDFSEFPSTRFHHTGKMTPEAIRTFQMIIYTYYRAHGRTFPWRETENPYHILVSEIMLQQTQVQRVIHKYLQFIHTFPDFSSLAQAPLKRVLHLWHGLGYNRRALHLKRIAEIVVTQFGHTLPRTPDVLQTFPGIGKATAGAIAVFAFNEPAVFVETNIRSVFIHFFFQDRPTVKDTEIYPLVEQTLDTAAPRTWYYGLTDYGVMLKKLYTSLNKKSYHYQKQSPFEGSDRQIRGKILEILITRPHTKSELMQVVGSTPERVEKILLQLEREEFIKNDDTIISIQ
jgi:A/G-specific adenine glycosylase